MFLSPGHSPLQISSPTPSSYSDDDLRRTSIISRNTRKRIMRVLDEDTYVKAIEKIIERDYFPDISKLRDRLDWIEAVKTRDPIQIRDAQLKIIERREGKIQTPGSTFLRNFTPVEEFDGKELLDSDVRDGDIDIDVNLSLDEFFRRYTSEDNHSFSKILKKKEKFSYHDDAKNMITDGYGTSDQPRGEAPLTVEERAVRLFGLTKEIVKGNTRFHGKTMDYKPRQDDSIEILYTPITDSSPIHRNRDKSKRYDLDDLRNNGYSFVTTPSPSPFITWGEIEGTPMRLDPEEEYTSRQHYNIPLTPTRDVIRRAHSLSKVRFKKPPLLLPSSPNNVRTLSPAAQKFFRRRTIAKSSSSSSSSSSVDESLRASYRGTSPGGLTLKSRKCFKIW